MIGTFHRAEGHHPGWARTDSGRYEAHCIGCDCIPSGGREWPTTDAATAAAAEILRERREQGR